jgi:long-chain acyl-CoA synthetase
MVLFDILQESYKKYGTHPALIMHVGYRTVTMTYIQVYESALKIAAFLDEHGVAVGDCVVVCAPNSPYWICLFWGCIIRGAIIVPLNTQSTDDMIAKIISHTNPKVFFTSYAHSVQKSNVTILGKTKIVDIEDLARLIASGDYNKLSIIHNATSDDVVEILYTSGTTGDPKGVVLTNGNLAANVQSMVKCLKLRPKQERLLSILPLSHIFEQTIGFLLPFTCGATIVYAHSHGAIAALLVEFQITKMAAVPEFLKILIARIMTKASNTSHRLMINSLIKISLRFHWWWVRRLLFYSLRKSLGGCLNTIASGGASLDPELEEQWNAFGIQVLQGYGLTETSPVITSNTFAAHMPGSVGKVVHGVQLRLTNEGAIQVKGASVFNRYFKNEKKTQEAFTGDGWFMTGDIGTIDNNGFLFIKGRLRYMIKGSGAQNVFPEDIEEFLNRIDGVKDSCVVGLEQPGGAIQIHAVLLLEAGISYGEFDYLISSVNNNLATYQRIGGWTLWPDEDFPRSATRKIKKETVITFLKENKGKKIVTEYCTKSRLITILGTMTGIKTETIIPTTRLVDELSVDSLMTIELLSRIEETFGVSVEGWIITPTTTVAQVQELIDHGIPISKPTRLKLWPRMWWARLLRAIGQPILIGIIRLFVRVQVEGAENLKNVGSPLIFMPNHVSMIDSLLIMVALPPSIRRRIAFASAHDVLYKEYWFLVPFAELLAYAFPFPRKETENVAQGLTLMGQALDCGYSPVVFPEGKVSLSGQLQPLKAGAGLIASQMMVPVIPVALLGVPSIIKPETFFPSHRGSVTIRFGVPITIDRTRTNTEATAIVEHAMRKTVG